MRELADATVGVSPGTLLPLNSQFKLAHEGDNILPRASRRHCD